MNMRELNWFILKTSKFNIKIFIFNFNFNLRRTLKFISRVHFLHCFLNNGLGALRNLESGNSGMSIKFKI